jgi:protein TonB
VPCIDRRIALGFMIGAGLAGCAAPPAPAPRATAPVARAPAPQPAVRPTANPKVSHATNERAYRADGARAIYDAYPDSIYKGKLPPLLHAIVVAEIDVDANGNVRGVNMLRVPSHAPDVTARVRELIRRASPLPAPVRLGPVRYVDTWLVDKSGRFQLDTLTEGQL